MKAWKFDVVFEGCIGYGNTKEEAIDQLLDDFDEQPYNYSPECKNVVRSPENDEEEVENDD